MDIFSIFTLLGGLAFFLYGMSVLSSGLEKMAGGKLERALKKMTSNPFKGLLLGAGITIAIQSSSAMTVMLVGFVNSGIMQLRQTVGIIMGSNIGTTLTAWILSAAGLEGKNFLIKLLKPSSFAPIIALIGIMLIMLSKSTRKKDVGHLLIGFSILMFGMTVMSDAMSPLADSPKFKELLVMFENPVLGVLVGAIFTGIIQSSAASVSILQALSMTGAISFGMAIPIIMGQNIGTCVTSMLSSIGVNKNAKRVAAVHVSFNIIGTIICLVVFYSLDAIISFSFTSLPINMVQVAFVHSIFNVTTTVLLFPFTKQLERLSNIIVRDKENDEKTSFLDSRLLATPSVAIAECKDATIRMAELARESVKVSIQLFEQYDSKSVELIEANEKLIDNYEDSLGSYLVKLSSKELSEYNSKEISKILHVIGDLERISDHTLKIARVAQELYDKEISFSKKAIRELEVMTKAITEIISITIEALINNNIGLAKRVEPLEEVVDILKAELKKRHIKRLRKGTCTIELGFIFADLIANYERISDHCSNIAVCIIQVNESSFDTHEYLHDIKEIQNGDFSTMFEEYKLKYEI